MQRLQQPAFRMKRRSALDRHAAFVRRLERHRKAQEQFGQASLQCKPASARQLVHIKSIPVTGHAAGSVGPC